MNKTKIEWCDYTINPVKGLCPMGCPYCYARAMYKRFKWNPEIRWKSGMAHSIALLQKPSRIFVGSTIELFGEWVKPEWMFEILSIARLYKSHTFIFLTKQPECLVSWSPFPSNCWVGISITRNDKKENYIGDLMKIEAGVKFLSIEPLLYWKNIPTQREIMPMMLGKYGVGWIIIGQKTPVKLSTMPQVGWIEEIVKAADKAHIPVFLKDNLIPCVDQYSFAFSGEFPNIKLRQEFPAPNKEKE